MALLDGLRLRRNSSRSPFVMKRLDDDRSPPDPIPASRPTASLLTALALHHLSLPSPSMRASRSSCCRCCYSFSFSFSFSCSCVCVFVFSLVLQLSSHLNYQSFPHRNPLHPTVFNSHASISDPPSNQGPATFLPNLLPDTGLDPSTVVVGEGSGTADGAKVILSHVEAGPWLPAGTRLYLGQSDPNGRVVLIARVIL